MALRVRTVMTGAPGSPWYSSHVFGGDNESAAGQGASAVAAFWGACSAVMVDELTIQVQSVVESFDLGSGDIVELFSVDTDAIDGQAAGEALPWQTQALVHWRTGQYIAGREVRGRTFIPGLTQDSLDDGVLLGSTQATLLDAADDLRAANPYGLYIYSPTHAAARLVVGVDVPTKFAYLRSRRD